MILNFHANICGHMTMFKAKLPFTVAEVEIQHHVHLLDINKY